MAATETDIALRACGITRRFGERTALDDVDLELAGGQSVAIIGPNGAGKTTLLSILAGMAHPDGGTVETNEGGVGWVPQQTALYHRLTVVENLAFFARLRRDPLPRERVERMLDLTGLRDRRDDRLDTLSGGNRQRVNIAVGLMTEPSVLLLDEPSVGLDPAQRSRLWQFILGLTSSGTAVAFSTHDIGEAERYADRIVVIAGGRVRFDGDATGLVAASGRPGGSLEGSFLALLEGNGS